MCHNRNGVAVAVVRVPIEARITVQSRFSDINLVTTCDLVTIFQRPFFNLLNKIQAVSCEIKFAHAHVRAHSHVCDVRAKSLLKCACDVRACDHFSSVRSAIAISHVFWQKRPKFLIPTKFFASFWAKQTRTYAFS